jgi:Ca-activated chloride channel family protein
MRSWGLAWLALVPLLTGFGCSRRIEQTPPVPSLQRSEHTVTVKMSYGSEKDRMIRDAIAAFEGNHPATRDGDAIHIDAKAEGSTEAFTSILAGRSEYNVWSPASSLLVEVMNDRWAESHGGRKVTDDAPSVCRSPVTIAMWEPMARALGRPELNIGWADIVKLSSSPDGWARFGHSEWGMFKFGHTHPLFSNSGLLALVASTYAGAGKRSDLTSADVVRAADFVRQVEASVVHYGRSSAFFADEMFLGGPAYLSAAVMYESDVVDSYLDPRYKDKAFPVVAVYPKDGTLWADHPYAILDLPNTTPGLRDGAEQFRRFLLSPERQRIALRRFGFRPADPQAHLGPPLDPAHGVDPAEPRSVLANPPPYVTRQIFESFQQLKRPVTVTFVVDVSNSMAGAPLDQARSALKELIGVLPGEDKARLLSAGSAPRWLIERGEPLTSSRRSLEKAADAIVMSEGDSLLDSILLASQSGNEDVKLSRRAIIVFSDGQQQAGQKDVDELLHQLEATTEVERPRVFVVTCGPAANQNLLKQIAAAGSGRVYAADPDQIKAMSEELAAFF